MKASKVVLGLGVLGVAGLAWYNKQQKSREYPPIFFRKSLPNGQHSQTIPPLGIFIQENAPDREALIAKEMPQWEHFQRVGLSQYYNDQMERMLEDARAEAAKATGENRAHRC